MTWIGLPSTPIAATTIASVAVAITVSASGDVLVENLPQDYSGMCGSECVDIASLSSVQASVFYREPNKRRVIILEDVKGDRVYLDFSSPIDAFDEYMPEAQKVVDSVKWSGS